MATRTGERESLIPRTPAAPQGYLPGEREARCSLFKGIFYFTGTVVSVGAIGVGIFNIATDPPQVLVTVARWALPAVGGLLLGSMAKNMGDIFKRKQVVVIGPLLEGQSSDASIIEERRTMLKLIEQIARNNKIAIPTDRVEQTKSALNEAISKRLDSIHQTLMKSGVVLNNYATLNLMLDQLLGAFQIDIQTVSQYPIDQQATIKLQMLQQALYRNPEAQEEDM